MTAISVKRLFVGACPVFLPDRPPESFTHQGLNSFSQCGIGAYIARENHVGQSWEFAFLPGHPYRDPRFNLAHDPEYRASGDARKWNGNRNGWS